jgi:hypothetical protein
MESVRLGVLLPGSVAVGDGINQARRGMVRTTRGDIPVIVKAVPRREIAVELLCALLGQRLGLAVPEPVLVALPDHDLAFGSADVGHPSFRHYLQVQNDPHILQRLLDWPQLVRAASFDDWIANPDRHVGNVLFDGAGQFWLIDHGLALAQGLDPAASVNNQLLDLARHGRDELALQRLKRDLIGFAETYRREDVQAAGDRVPLLHAVELVDFLTVRLAHLTGFVRKRLHPRQQDIDYGG